MSQFITNLDIYMLLKASGSLKNSVLLYDTLLSRINLEMPAEDLGVLKVFTKTYVSNLHKRWLKANRCQEKFFNKNIEWLHSDITLPSLHVVVLQSLFVQENTSMEVHEDLDNSLDLSLDAVVASTSSCSDATTNTSVQRKPFEDLSNKQKRKRLSSLKEHSEEELLMALVNKLKDNEYKKPLAEIIDCLYKDNVKTEYIHNHMFKKKSQKTVPQDEALALITGLDLSKWQYLTLRKVFGENTIALPSYHKIVEAKKSCYPKDMVSSESSVRIKLQSILNLTMEKIIKVVQDRDCESLNVHRSFKLISKWGCDGSSSHSTYKQKVREEFSDSSVFMTSLVPLRLIASDVIIWENPRPSSTNYCRPIMFEFVKETKEHIQQHTAAMEKEISNLVPTKIGDLEVSHDLHMTMIDGKVSTALSETSSHANCNICHATPKEMNNLNMILIKQVAEEMFKYGLSSLHMWIRCMECLLHISYNMDFKKWAARGDDKLLQKSRKELTQEELFKQTGLLVDVVKQGYGTTNDGNTARRFFRDFEKSAEITGVDKKILKRFAVILQTIASGKNINILNFKNYCFETAKLYVELYPWYYMPYSIHKLLIHGAEICQHFGFIPVGMLSEEASEARNKDFRRIREAHSRKIGRKETNTDIIHQLLISSDPHITNIRPVMMKNRKMEFFPEVDDLIINDEPMVAEELIECDVDDVFISLEDSATTDPLA